MSDARAIQATYYDLKFIKTRKVAQITLEVPIEQGDAVVQMFGTPKPDKEMWVAIARLDKETATVEGGDADEPRPSHSRLDIADGGGAEAAPAKPKQSWYDMQPSQRAGILCNDGGFQEWIVSRGGHFQFVENDSPEDRAIFRLRHHCRIYSRAWLDDDNEKFDAAAFARFIEIETAYRIHAGKEAEER